MIFVVHPGSAARIRIPDPEPDFLPILDLGSRGQKGTGSRTRNTVSGDVFFCHFFFGSYWLARFVTFLQAPSFLSYWLEDFANFTPTTEDNDQYNPTITFGET
jgi:hypothetical protein